MIWSPTSIPQYNGETHIKVNVSLYSFILHKFIKTSYSLGTILNNVERTLNKILIYTYVHTYN